MVPKDLLRIYAEDSKHCVEKLSLGRKQSDGVRKNDRAGMIDRSA